MKENYKIYMHINKTNGKVYIGVTKKSLNDRWRNGKAYDHCPRFDGAINKYSWDNFEHVVLYEGLTYDEANMLEQEMIAKYNSTDPKYGYNICSGGYINRGRKLTDEQKQNISEGRKGKMTKEDNHWYGRKMPKDLIDKRSETFKENYKKENHPMYGREQTDKQKEMGKRIGEFSKAIMSKTVEQYDLKTGDVINTFYSTREAGRQTGFDSSGISKCCRGKQKTAYGFGWRYVEKDISNLPKTLTDRTIYQIDINTHEVIGTYYSLKEASKATGLTRGSINYAMQNGMTAGGFLWEYTEKDAY